MGVGFVVSKTQARLLSLSLPAAFGSGHSATSPPPCLLVRCHTPAMMMWSNSLKL